MGIQRQVIVLIMSRQVIVLIMVVAVAKAELILCQGLFKMHQICWLV